jgi:hypothetical protein
VVLEYFTKTPGQYLLGLVKASRTNNLAQYNELRKLVRKFKDHKYLNRVAGIYLKTFHSVF